MVRIGMSVKENLDFIWIMSIELNNLKKCLE